MNMPDFLILGVAKAGTTSTYAYLAEHPQIAMCNPKEPHFFECGEIDQLPSPDFFSLRWAIKTLPQYQALFADLPATKLRGEASPTNIESRACARIHRYLPAARFILTLRQPVERAYSTFIMNIRQGKEPETDFRQAYLDTPRRWQRRFEQKAMPFGHYDASWYVNRLQDWFERFPRQQMQISLYDDLKADPIAYMRQIYTFLEVDDTFVANVSQVHNQGSSIHSRRLNQFIRQDDLLKQWARAWISRSMRGRIKHWLKILNRAPLPPLDPQVRRELTLPQQEDILRLQDLIGRDLKHWLA